MSLTQLWVIPQETPTQSQAQSSTVDPEPSQIEDTPDSDQEDPHSGTPELEQLFMAQEEQVDYDFPSPMVTKAPLWRFAQQSPSGSRLRLNLRLQRLRLSP